MDILIFLPLIVMCILFLLRIPVGLSMICTAIIFFLVSGKNIGLVSNVIMSNLYFSSTIIAVPMFVFTANIMDSGMVTERLFTFTKALVGQKRGAMAYINIIFSLIFSGITGSAAADAAGIGTMEISEMKKDGYDMPFSAAITATTATVGPIFPPSIPMVMYAMLAGVSVGKLFMGGMIPAILLCFSLGVYVWYISKKRNYPKGMKFSFREFLKYTLKAIPALLTPVILLGGIYSGIVTATEAGVMAAFYTILISVFVYRNLRFKGFMKVVRKTVIQTGVIFLILAGAYIISFITTSTGLGKIIADWFLSITNNKYVFLLIINVVFIGLGMFFDTMVLVFVFIPLVIPVASALGIDMVHFGVILVVNMMVGMSTPPYGMLCYITGSIAKAPLQKVFKEALPMVGIMIIVLLLITYVPIIVTGLPNLLIP